MSQSKEPLSSPTGGAAKWFGEFNQVDFDIEFFEKIIERNPDYVQVLRLLGELLARKGLYERSQRIDRRLVRLAPTDGVARYNLACSLAMCGHQQEAIAELRSAIENGYNDFGYLEMDSDLDSLRSDPEFQALLSGHLKKRRRQKKK
ncbi:MAG TPA: hypothetical protein VFE24_14600 [Pirellulales bacterium]|jgi:tetratricopeptide (TPR) repeat protein|nr:hypothetical protein [Pirellulales bacterium]